MKCTWVGLKLTVLLLKPDWCSWAHWGPSLLESEAPSLHKGKDPKGTRTLSTPGPNPQSHCTRHSLPPLESSWHLLTKVSPLWALCWIKSAINSKFPGLVVWLFEGLLESVTLAKSKNPGEEGNMTSQTSFQGHTLKIWTLQLWLLLCMNWVAPGGFWARTDKGDWTF